MADWLAVTACVFCAIGAGRIPATVVRRAERVVVFEDLHPQAPAHLLAIPKDHFENVAQLAAADADLLAELIVEAESAAAAVGLDSGYRIVFNTGADGGQTVPHVHAHILGGRKLSWPPG